MRIYCDYIFNIYEHLINRLTVDEVDLFDDCIYDEEDLYKQYPYFTIAGILYKEYMHHRKNGEVTYTFKIFYNDKTSL